jgi:hypothetical protein
MGILNIVFGSLFLLCYLCNGVQLIMQSSGKAGGFGGANDPGVELANQMQAEIPGLMVHQVSTTLLHLALSVLLLSSGVGLLNMQHWARVGSIVYAVVTIILEIGNLIYQLAFINPVMKRVLEDMLRRDHRGPGGGPEIGTLMNIITVITVIVYILLMVYAIVLLIMMLRPSVAAAFGAGPPPEEPLVDRYGEGGDEYERRRDPWNY